MNDKTDEFTNITSEKSMLDLNSLANSEKSTSRRRLILSGVLKGSALAAAAVPIKSFASTSSITANGKLCTCSGTQSAAHSQKANLPTCGGLRAGYYEKLKNWPNYNGSADPPIATPTLFSGATFNQNTPFNSVFGSGPSETLIYIMQNSATSTEYHYIAALLNAIKPPSGYVFPYNTTEVINFYKSPQQLDALTFFKDYMETIKN